VIISCPNCSTGYLLPEHLVGPGGARVRCPRCQDLFAVDVEGRPRAPVPPAATPGRPPFPRPLEALAETTVAAAPPPGTAESDADGRRAVARAVLDRLSAEQGDAIGRARDAGRFFAEFGPALMLAFEAYRRRAGESADPGAFRTALRERWGVELVPLTKREA
jgi:predicted Zn finger-like uncharacterized protein